MPDKLNLRECPDRQLQTDFGRAMALRAEAKRLEAKAKGLTEEANALVADRLRELGRPVLMEGVGELCWAVGGKTTTFDKKAAVAALVAEGVDPAVVSAAFKIATTEKERAASIRFTAAG